MKNMSKSMKNVVLSIVIGTALTGLSLILVFDNRCFMNVGCSEKIGLPLVVFRGPHHTFVGFDVLIFNYVFWCVLSLIIFALLIPLLHWHVLPKRPIKKR